MNRNFRASTKSLTHLFVEPLEERRVLSANILSELELTPPISAESELVNEFVPEPIQQTEISPEADLGLGVDLAFNTDTGDNLPVPGVEVDVDVDVNVRNETTTDVDVGIEVPIPNTGDEGGSENPPPTRENGGSEISTPSSDFFFQYLNSSRPLSLSAAQQQQENDDLQIFLWLRSMNDSELIASSNVKLEGLADKETKSVLFSDEFSAKENEDEFNANEEKRAASEVEQQFAKRYGVDILYVLQDGALLPVSGTMTSANEMPLASATADLGAIDQALNAFLHDIDELAATLKDWLLRLGPMPWIIMGLAVTMSIATTARQRWRKLRRQMEQGDELALLSLPGWPMQV